MSHKLSWLVEELNTGCVVNSDVTNISSYLLKMEICDKEGKKNKSNGKINGLENYRRSGEINGTRCRICTFRNT